VEVTQAGPGRATTGGMPAVEPPPKGAPARPAKTAGGRPGLTVGVIAPSYGLEHVTYAMHPEGVAFGTLRAVTARRFEKRSQFFAHTPLVIGGRADLVHSFNHLPLQVPPGRPFVVSSELELPRILGTPAPWQVKWGLDALESDACRRILPLSDAAARFITKRFDAAGRPALAAKVEVFRGAVLPPPALRAPRDGGPVRLLFVGGDGLRKGLGAAVAAARRLNEGGIEAHLTVIGRATETTYALPGRTISADPLRAELSEAPWITHHVSLPNAEVRAHMADADALLLPTVDESLGWVVIEAALTGLPTMGTGIFAIPELIDHNRTGWLLPADTDADGRWAHLAGPQAMEAWGPFQDALADAIIAAAEAIAGDPALPDRMGEAARETLSALYLPDRAAPRLRAIYDAALAGAPKRKTDHAG
jgi:glycosyltransferase involved in cell wall biosynthesis